MKSLGLDIRSCIFADFIQMGEMGAVGVLKWVESKGGVKVEGGVESEANILVKLDSYKYNNLDMIVDRTVDRTVDKETDSSTNERILSLLAMNPSMTQGELATVLGLSDCGVEYAIGMLRKAKRLRKVGGKRFGHWEIIDKEPTP